jgi:hypothetical protein
VPVRLVVFVGWFVVTAVPLGYLTAAHIVPLPSDRMARAGAAWHEAAARTWQAIHVLSPDCRCSLDVAAYLTDRGALRDVIERVWLVRPNPLLARRLAASGFQVETVGADAVERDTGIGGVPWLMFVTPGNRVAYSGGYLAAEARRGTYQDVAVWQDLQAGLTRPGAAVFGCPTSRGLTRARDPLGLKALALMDPKRER